MPVTNQTNLNSEFSPYVIEQVGWYVYALQDPRDQRIFYIGKGRGNRVFAHALAAIEESDGQLSAKLSLIKQIHAENLKVNTFILRHGISSEKAAYEIEATAIDLLFLMDKSADNKYFQLTNEVRGHHHDSLGSMSTDNIIAIYDAAPCPEIKEEVLLFRIPLRWNPLMTADELYESTHGWWRLGTRKNGAKYAMAVSAGVIRAIYKIDSWELRTEGKRGYKKGEKPRFGFNGRLITELDQYLNKSVKHLYKVGEQTPFKYLNC
jgi:hypothetical protein